MKKVLLLSAIILAGIFIAFGQTTATDFTANDCTGQSHNLFSELDDGKVIVLAWVMPCGSCISDPLSAFTTVSQYATSHPGQVLFYMADDYANTSCGSLMGWAANYGMGNSTIFSNASIRMSDYGVDGMPKIVVLGGSDHKVYFNKNSSAVGIGSAIDMALDDIAKMGLMELDNSPMGLKSFPNPANNVLKVTYNLDKSSTTIVEVINLGSGNVAMMTQELKSSGEHNSIFDISELSNGTYMIKVSSNSGVEAIRFVKTY